MMRAPGARRAQGPENTMKGDPSTATVSARGAARLRAGHPWVFRQDVVRGPAKDARDGGPLLVEVRDPRGKPLATATWAAEARLALRVVARGTEAAPRDLLALVGQRLDAALARRHALAPARDAMRIVHAESDGLPGLVVDRYADAAVIQTMSVAMNALREPIAALVRERLGVRLVVARDDGSARDFEGLPRFSGIVAGPKDAPTRVEYRLGPNRLEADLMTDSKTGGFLDQADNHAAVAALAPENARALDAFTYHGGFALALARRGGPVLATDEDPTAVGRATENARRNGLLNLEVRRANAFDLLRELEGRGEAFDVVVLDPPALAKRGAGPTALTAADRAYKELFLRGARLTRPGGLLVACSCSGRVTRAHFDEIVAAA